MAIFWTILGSGFKGHFPRREIVESQKVTSLFDQKMSDFWGYPKIWGLAGFWPFFGPFFGPVLDPLLEGVLRGVVQKWQPRPSVYFKTISKLIRNRSRNGPKNGPKKGQKMGLFRSAKRLTRVPTAKLLFISAFSRILSIWGSEGSRTPFPRGSKMVTPFKGEK